VTASFGAAQRTEHTASAEELVDMADQALLVAKNTGRDRVTSYLTMNDSTSAVATSAPSGSFDQMLARDVMTTLVAGLHQDDKVVRAIEYFLQLRINSAPVVDDQGRLTGMLSDKDAMAILLWPRWWETTIAQVMRKGVVSYEEETPARVIYEFMCRVSIRSVIVVKEGRPTGVISRASLLRWFTNALVSRGEAGDWKDLPRLAESPEEAAEQVAAIADTLAEQALQLKRDFAADEFDWAPRIVGGASRMQELLTDLLAYSRAARPAAPAADANSAGETVQGLYALLLHTPAENGA
jgi:CBS domain-containing protein